MIRIVDAAIGRSRMVLFMLGVLLFSGIFTYITIPKEANPDIPIPFAYVSIVYQGISPEDSERLLIKPMEVELRSLEGLKELTAIASQGHAGIVLEFDVNSDMDQVLIDVREKVDLAKAEIPDEAEEPTVTEFNQSLFPAIIVALSGDVPERSLYQLARRTKDELEALPNVLSAELVGNREELLEVVIDPAKLEAYQISATELINAVTLNNQLVPAGTLELDRGRFNVKVPGLFETREDVMSLAIRSSGEGVVTLGDLADIRRTFKDRQGYARVNGEPAIAIEVVKRLGTNVIETNLQVREVVEAARTTWPDAVDVDYLLDTSKFIKDSLSELEASVLTAIMLVMIVVVAALGVKSGILVGISIPTSILLAFLFLGITGLTVNMMVMFGMVIAVGMLVDASIVIVEYADMRLKQGWTRVEAYADAAKRMFWPITSSTLTTLAAFFPMLFWPGMSGKFMSYLPFTLIYVLAASLLVALIFLPALGAAIGGGASGKSDDSALKEPLEHADIDSLPGITGTYTRFVRRAIEHPFIVIGAATGVLMTIIVVFSMFNRGVEFFVETQPEQAKVQIGARGNLSSDEILRLVQDVEEIVMGIEGVRTVFTATGGNGITTGEQQDVPVDTIGTLSIELTDWRYRPKSTDIFQEIRDKTKHLAGIRIEVAPLEQGPPTGKDIQIELTGVDGTVLDQETRRVRGYLETMGGLIEVEDTLPLPGIEWQLTLDREQAGRFGADVSTIGAFVQLVTNGVLVGTYRPDDADDEVDIRVRFPDEARRIERLDELRIQTNQGLVPISNFVSRSPEPQVDSITRVDGKRTRTIRANAAPGVLANDKVQEITALLEANPLAPGVDWRFRGADEEQKESQQFLTLAMFASLFLMGIVLLTQFNNFYHAALVLSAVFISVFGALIGMLVMGQAFSVIMTGTGIVALAGIVVNNNIVLIDTYQDLRRKGFDVVEAAVRTSALRLRPVFLTTVTTICGLLPMVLQLNFDFFNREISYGGPNAVWWEPLSTAIVFGLGFATVLTLVLTPCMLVLPHHIKEVVTGLAHRRFRRAPAE